MDESLREQHAKFHRAPKDSIKGAVILDTDGTETVDASGFLPSIGYCLPVVRIPLICLLLKDSYLKVKNAYRYILC